jgi:hypothetical protein
MDHVARFLAHRLHEELAWMRAQLDPDSTEAEAMAYLRDQCGYSNGGCRYWVSDYCALDCPFRPEDL